MDRLTKDVKNQIKLQHRSIRAFCEKFDFSYTTLVSALSTSIENTAFATVVKLLKSLNMDISEYLPHDEVDTVSAKINSLDKDSVEKLTEHIKNKK